MEYEDGWKVERDGLLVWGKNKVRKELVGLCIVL